METGPLDLRVLRNLFLEALDEHEHRAKPARDESVVLKGYLVEPCDTIEPSVVDVLSELDRRARRTAA